MKILYSTLFILLISTNLYSQAIRINGTISDTEGNPLIGASVKVKNLFVGSVTDTDGNFSFNFEGVFPVTLKISSLGYTQQEIIIEKIEDLPVKVSLSEKLHVLGQEVVVSASRYEESILEAPVSIEKMDLLAIQNTPSSDFYGALLNMKNVDMSTQSFTFRSITMRGFNANGNTRIVQLVDGMDNQAPGLNFPVGNVVGMSELDLESVELLPGAASALYGPNAINGIILMNSKNPFDYQGLSTSVKLGVNHVDNEDHEPSPFTETSLRYAKAFNKKFAFKVNASFLDAEDWQANDLRNRNLDPNDTRSSDPSYEAINIYGDETSTLLPLGPNGENISVSRTGFRESDLVDYTARSFKFSSAIHYRFNDNLEAVLQANYGTGQSVYTGIDRYSLNGFKLSQYKAELKGNNFTVRAYTTQENSGDSYAIGTLGLALNEALAPSEVWFQEYAGAYSGAIPGVEAFSHDAAREFADRNMPAPGSEAYENAKESIMNTPLSEGGAKFLDKTDLYAVEGTYDFSDQLSFIDLIVGANYRVYKLNSEGTLFAMDDTGDEFSIAEYGGFIQASKKLLKDKLKLTFSMRYDKNENFDGRTTPRVSGVFEFLDKQFLRMSYQTGFRMPTTQNQYIDLLTPQARLIGGLPLFRERYNFDNNPVYTQDTYGDYVGTFLTTQGESLASGQSQSEAFVTASTAAGGVLIDQEVGETTFEMEQNQTFEIGYKGLIAEKLFIDAYYYNSVYNNFSGSLNLFQSSTTANDPQGLLAPTVYQTTVSLDQQVKSQGAAIGFTYALNKGFTFGGNYAWNELTNIDDLPEGFQSGFNTPKHKINISLSNRKLTERLGFSLNWRWQDAFIWESTFAQGEVPSFSTFDIQATYNIPALKSKLKVGGSNIFNQRYEQALGNPTVGALYYVTFSFDDILK